MASAYFLLALDKYSYAAVSPHLKEMPIVFSST